MENKYENGKIYKIWNELTDDIYVGSTCNLLCKRMARHRSNSLDDKLKQRKLYKLMNEVGVDIFHIELIELFPCTCMDELRKREGYYIRKFGNLNLKIEGRTSHEYNEEYYEQHIDTINQYQNEYRIINKNKTKEYYNDNTDKLKQYRDDYNTTNKDNLRLQCRAYYANNKERLNSKVQCPCGGSYAVCHKAVHAKTLKHSQYEESLKI